MKKKYVISGLALGLVAGTGAGLVMQQSGFAGASNTPAIVATATDDAAGAPAERGGRIAEVLAPLVADGTITQAQADAVVDALVAAMPERGDHDGPGHGGHRRGPRLEAAATALGMTVEELRTELKGGATLAQVAEAQGVEVQVVIDALVDQAEAHLAEEVASGEHTQEEADAKLADITERITDMVNNGRPGRGEG